MNNDIGRKLGLGASALFLMFGACVEDTTSPAGFALDGGALDASTDARASDAAADGTETEAGPDAETDASVDASDAATIDAANDADVDASADASGDAEVDGSVDADVDASSDAAADAASDAASDALVDAGPPGNIPTSNVAATQVDLVSPGDVGISPDGTTDGTFEITVSGPIDGVILVTTDAAGNPANGQQWDTLSGADAIPTGLGFAFSSGSQTWVLGVFEGGVLQNDASGHVSLGAGPHALTLVASSSGYFVTGQHFRLYAHATGGAWAGGPVVTWP